MRILYKELTDKTKYDTNPSIKLIIFHGSRITKNTTTSDLDVFILTSENKNYKESHIIKGVKYDINIISLDDLETAISISDFNHNQYFYSILKTGIVMKNDDQAFEFFETIMSIHDNHKNKKSLLSLKAALYKFFASFEQVESIEDKKHYYYYNVLEEIRKLYYIESGISYLNPCKVLDSYNNPNEYLENYCIKLPPSNFIELYKKALETKDNQERKNIVYKLLEYLKENISFDDYSEEMDYWNIDMSDEDIKLELININNMKKRVIEKLKNKEANAESLYCILVERMRKLYLAMHKYDKGIANISVLNNKALSTHSKKEQIQILNQYMLVLSENKKIDFDEYKLEYTF